MPEMNITGWLDPALQWGAMQAGIPVADYSAGVGGEGIGNGLELVADYFTKGWLNKLVQGVTGLVACGYAILGSGVNMRLRKELSALGTHELFTIVRMTGSEALAVQQSLLDTVGGAQKGDWTKVLGSILKTPAEIGLPTAPPPTPPPATKTPSVIVQSPAKKSYQVSEKPPAVTVPRTGRYVVTG